VKVATFIGLWAVVGMVSIALAAASRVPDGCRTQPGVVRVEVSVSKYPHVWRHMVDARAGRNTASDGKTIVRDGLRWPTVLRKNDHGEDQRRAAAFAASGVPTKRGFDRDEYPPAEGRSSNLADIRYVPSSENRSQGASMGGQLRKWCNGQRYRTVRKP
jgi:hypothetical protein